MQPIALLNVVGLSARHVVPEHMPSLHAFLERTRARTGGLHAIRPPLPAVTTTVQSSFVTGLPPSGHGIVGNGWFDRTENEVRFWKQSNALVRGDRLWDVARDRDAAATCANICWWYAMYASCDATVTPRPMYPADGRKIPDCWTDPPHLRDALQREHGTFPLFRFWGPATDISSTRWIASAAIDVSASMSPTITLVYLPHLDYGLQKLGPDHPEIPTHLREIDAEIGRLIAHFEARGTRPIVLSEYGIVPVRGAVEINRVLRRAGLVAIRGELDREVADVGASEAFAVCDHQVAHVVVRDPERIDEVRALLAETEGVDAVHDRAAQHAIGLAHERSGDLVCVSAADRWFAYPWWLDDARAPDYARTVDIHRKPGYDPCELFLDPALAMPKARIAWALAKRRLGFRALMEVIPLDPSVVRGSHGRVDHPAGFEPVLIGLDPGGARDASGGVPAEAVRDLALAAIFDGA